MIRLRDYIDPEGRSRFARWFDRLDPFAAERVTIALARIERGVLSNIKSVGSGVHECKIDFGPGYRIYFGWDGETLVILLGGGAKQRQQADIALAQRYWAGYKRRKALGEE